MLTHFKRSGILFFLLGISFLLQAQQKKASISGIITDDNGKALSGVVVEILNASKKVITNDTGFFSITVIANKPMALVFSYTGFLTIQKNFYPGTDEKEFIRLQLQRYTNELQAVTIKDQRERQQAGLNVLDANKALLNPSPIGGIEGLIKTLVGSNNELSSQYNVRGGSYDENLVYVNDFEVYRPYLVRSGQQEGLSFINPELTGNVRFYNGGFQAKYGDKMSSVLDITYRKPTRNSGSAYLGLLEQGLHLEGTANHNKVTYLLGLRNRSNKNLLSSQETTGNYIPSSADWQSLITWQVSTKWRLEAMANISATSFRFYPKESQLTSGVFSPLYSSSLGLDIFFQGQEKDKYSTGFVGLSAIHQPTRNLQLKWMVSYFNNSEQENIDITGAFLFGERDVNNGGGIVNPLGAGVNQNYARNALDIDVYTAAHKGTLDKGRHFIQWGNSIERQLITDHQNEWEYRDSAGYSLPNQPGPLSLFSAVNSTTQLGITRISGYVQDNIRFADSSGFTMQLGARYNYNTLNKEFLVSPRAGLSFKPQSWKKDIVIRVAAGVYVQPPFYREMRRFDGSLNTGLLSQKSYQLSGGFDYQFSLFQRPARFSTELYYKFIKDAVPYDIDNVRLRYYGQNNAKAYATGIEARLFGELVKDAESWISLGLMRTRENINNDSYTTYTNAGGEIIGPATIDKIPTDSSVNAIGWLRRPTDRLVTFGLFFQDYLSTNKNIKVYFNTIYGSNLPYNIPGNARYRNALQIEPYIRVDMGFSALLLTAQSNRRSHSPFKNFTDIWATLEIFNVIDRANTISYQLVKDYGNNTYTIPNRLTPRLLNVKIIARW